MNVKVKLLISLVIIVLATVGIVVIIGKGSRKDISNNNNVTVTPTEEPTSSPERVISLDEEKLVTEVKDRVQELYKSNGLMYINFSNDASNGVSVILRDTGEAYMESGSDVRVYLNNGKAIVATNPIEILEEAIPIEVIKGMLSNIELGTGDIERVEVEDGKKAIKISISGIEDIIKAYSYISNDYGWTVMTGLGITEDKEVQMQVYLYDKKETDDTNVNWTQFECECIFNVNGEKYSYWWTIGAEKLSKPFEMGEAIYKLDKGSNIELWKKELTTISNSVYDLIKELREKNKNKVNTENNDAIEDTSDISEEAVTDDIVESEDNN